MTFIPNLKRVRIGDRVKLLEAKTVAEGTFTVGHEFTVTSYCVDHNEDLWTLTDDEDRALYVTGTRSIERII